MRERFAQLCVYVFRQNLPPGEPVTSDASAQSIEVETVSLDDLFDRGEIPAPDVLKIDVEGGELEVLEWAGKLIAEARPAIFLATHGAEVHEKCCDVLRGFGYQLTPLSGQSIENCDEILALPQRGSES